MLGFVHIIFDGATDRHSGLVGDEMVHEAALSVEWMVKISSPWCFLTCSSWVSGVDLMGWCRGCALPNLRWPSSSYSLLKFVYFTSQLWYSLVVHSLLTKILDLPLGLQVAEDYACSSNTSMIAEETEMHLSPLWIYVDLNVKPTWLNSFSPPSLLWEKAKTSAFWVGVKCWTRPWPSLAFVQQLWFRLYNALSHCTSGEDGLSFCGVFQHGLWRSAVVFMAH